MLINLSDVLSDQHKTVEETVPLTMKEVRMKSGTYPIVESEPVHVRVEHVRGKELLIYALFYASLSEFASPLRMSYCRERRSVHRQG